MNNTLFSPAQYGRAGEDIALQIEAAIIGGRIAPGERLPSERELQVQFHTCRGVIREALGALKQKGLIEIKKGAKGGAFVKEVEMTLVSASLALFLKQRHVDPNYLIEFRESVDRTITTLAIARGTTEEKDQLVAGAERLVRALKAPEPDMGLVYEIDRELNLLLARMTRNPLFEWIMRAIQSGLSSNDYTLYTNPDFRGKTAINWLETARGISRGEPLRALSFTGNHYVLLRSCLEAESASPSTPAGDYQI